MMVGWFLITFGKRAAAVYLYGSVIQSIIYAIVSLSFWPGLLLKRIALQ